MNLEALEWIRCDAVTQVQIDLLICHSAGNLAL
jgi:hypothetical protein